MDPGCAMCFWGLAQAEGFRHSDAEVYGKKALAEAVRLKNRASASDKLYIEAAQVESNAKDDDGKPAVPIYRKLVKKFPRDTQARIFLAEALCDGYDDAGEPKPGQKECISDSLKRAFGETRPTIRRRITTGSTPSNPAIIPNAPLTVPPCWPASRRLPATWCTCPAISTTVRKLSGGRALVCGFDQRRREIHARAARGPRR